MNEFLSFLPSACYFRPQHVLGILFPGCQNIQRWSVLCKTSPNLPLFPCNTSSLSCIATKHHTTWNTAPLVCHFLPATHLQHATFFRNTSRPYCFLAVKTPKDDLFYAKRLSTYHIFLRHVVSTLSLSCNVSFVSFYVAKIPQTCSRSCAIYVSLRCKNATNTSLMRLISSSRRLVMYLFRVVLRHKYSLNTPVLCTSLLKLKQCPHSHKRRFCFTYLLTYLPSYVIDMLFTHVHRIGMYVIVYIAELLSLSLSVHEHRLKM